MARKETETMGYRVARQTCKRGRVRQSNVPALKRKSHRSTSSRNPTSTKRTVTIQERTTVEEVMATIDHQELADIQLLTALTDERTHVERLIKYHDLLVRRSPQIEGKLELDALLVQCWGELQHFNRITWSKTPLEDGIRWCIEHRAANEEGGRNRRTRLTKQLRTLAFLVVKECNGSSDQLLKHSQHLSMKYPNEHKLNVAIKKIEKNNPGKNDPHNPSNVGEDSKHDEDNDDELEHDLLYEMEDEANDDHGDDDADDDNNDATNERMDLSGGNTENTAEDKSKEYSFKELMEMNIIGDYTGQMMSTEEMTAVYWCEYGPATQLQKWVKKGQPKLDVRFLITSEDDNDSLIEDENAGIQKHEVLSEDGTRKATYFVMTGNDNISRRFLMRIFRNYRSETNACSSREIKRPPNNRMIRISTTNKKSVFSYAGGKTKNIVFVEADSNMSNLENDVVLFTNKLWNNNRNEAMGKYIMDQKKLGKPKWCLKQRTTLLQAAQGISASMNFGVHGDHGTEQCHKSVDTPADDKVWALMNHVSTMEVLTFSTLNQCEGEGIEYSRGRSNLNIYNSKVNKDKPAASIPMVGPLIHAQLAEAQRSTYHHPVVVDRESKDLWRTIISCRNTPDLWHAPNRHCFLKAIEGSYPTGLNAFSNTIVAHRQKANVARGSDKINFESDKWFSEKVEEYLSVKPKPTKIPFCLEKGPNKWTCHSYDESTKDRKDIEQQPGIGEKGEAITVQVKRPTPTNFVGVSRAITKITLSEQSRMAAQLEGYNINHHFRPKKVSIQSVFHLRKQFQMLECWLRERI